MSNNELRSAASGELSVDTADTPGIRSAEMNGHNDRATIETPERASVSNFLAQFEKPSNVALMPDKSLIKTPESITEDPLNGSEAPNGAAPPSVADFLSQQAGHEEDKNEEGAPTAGQDVDAAVMAAEEMALALEAQGNSEAAMLIAQAMADAAGGAPADHSQEEKSGPLNTSTDSSTGQYVPESLSTFLKEAESTIEVTKQETIESPARSGTSPSSGMLTASGKSAQGSERRLNAEASASAGETMLSPDLATPPPNPHHDIGPNTAKRMALDDSPEAAGEQVMATPSVDLEPEKKEEQDDRAIVDKALGRSKDNPAVDPGLSEDVEGGGPEHVGEVDESMEVPFDGQKRAAEDPERPQTPPTAHPADYSPRRSSSPKLSPRSRKSTSAFETPPSPSALSRKSTGTQFSLKEGSRLLQPTAASAGFSGGSTGDRKSSGVDLEASRKRAQERIRREHKMRQLEEQHQQRRSASATRQIRMSPEEGQARARARVKIRQEMSSGGKENAGNARSAVSSSPPKKRSSRPLTVPKGPNFATDRRAAARSATRTRQDEHSVTSYNSRATYNSRSYRPSSNIRGSDERSVASASTRSSRRPLTVPQAPKFALDAKYGAKVAERRAQVLKDRDDHSVASQSVASQSTRASRASKRSVTVPQAPKFALDARYGEKRSSPRKGDASLAKTGEKFAQTLRTDATKDKSTWHKGRVTVPVAPKFHSMNKRAVPKSTEERELEMMEKFNRSPFKARPLPGAAGDGGSVRSGRSGTSRSRKAYAYATSQQAEEPRGRQFRARPMPDFNKAHERASSATKSREKEPEPEEPPSVTVGKSQPTAHKSPVVVNAQTSQLLDTDTPKARPRAEITPATPEEEKQPPDTEPRPLKEPGPPHLDTAARSHDRQVKHEQSHNYADKIMEQEDGLSRHRMLEKAKAAAEGRIGAVAFRHGFQPEPGQFMGVDTTIVMPITLTEQPPIIKPENSPQKALTPQKFRAQPVPSSTYKPIAVPRPPKRSPTVPRAFAFQDRDEARRKERESKNKVPTHAYKFHANPVPKTTYHASPAVRPVDRQVTKPQAFKFDETGQVRKRKKQKQDMVVAFRAQPLPSTTYQPSPVRRRAKPETTSPQPFEFSASAKHKADLKEKRLLAARDRQVEPEPEFHARSVPKTTYEAARMVRLEKPKSTVPRPFKLHTNERHEAKASREHQNHHEGADRYRFRANPVPRSTYEANLVTPAKRTEATVPEPFEFQSAVRREAKAERDRQETEIDGANVEETMEFRANPVPKSTYVATPVQSPVKQPPTTPEPFELSTGVRHDACAEQGAGETAMHSFHAQPVPKTTYESPRLPQPAKTEPTVPHPFEFETSTRREARAEREVKHTEEKGDGKDGGFHAHPVPKSTYEARPVPRPAKKETTVAEPFQFLTSARQEARAERQHAKEELEKSANTDESHSVFHAHPVPKSTYEATKVIQPVKSTPTVPEPFSFRTEARQDARAERERLQLESEAQEAGAKAKSHAKHKPTVPQPFNFQTRARQEARIERERLQKQENEEIVERAFQAQPVPKSTYEAVSVPGPAKPQPTTPEPFEFRTSARHEARLERQMLEAEDGEAAAKDSAGVFRAQPVPDSTYKATSILRPQKVEPTVPQPFELLTSARHEARVGRKDVGDGDHEERAVPFRAQRIPRSTYEVEKSPQRTKAQATKPRPFQLHTNARHEARVEKERQLETEKESTSEEEYRFHARSVPKSTYKAARVSHTAKKCVTTTKPFQFQTGEKERAKKLRIAAGAEKRVEEPESARKFRALAVPGTTYKASKAVRPIKKSATVPLPFELQTNQRCSSRTKPEPAEQSHFVANSIPKTTYEASKVPRPPKVEPTVPHPFSFHTSARHEARLRNELDAMEDGGNKKEAPAHRFHAHAVPETTYKASQFQRPPKADPTVTQPFQLQTSARPEARAEWKKQIAERDGETRARAVPSHFRANPVPSTTYQATPTSKPARPEPTVPVPFELRTDARPEGRAEWKKKLDEDAEGDERDLSPGHVIFQAHPVPRTTYEATPTVKPPRPDPTVPHPFEFQTDSRPGARAEWKKRLVAEKEPAETATIDSRPSPVPFHANPVPETTYKAVPTVKPRKADPTVPQPFEFRTDARPDARLEWKKRKGIPDIVQDPIKQTFHAHPVPDTTYKARATSRPVKPDPTVPQPFEFQTIARHNARIEWANHRGEATDNPVRRLHAHLVPPTTYEAAPTVSVERPKPTVPIPFEFHTDTRHEARSEWEQRVAAKKGDAAEPGQENSFSAQPVPETTYNAVLPPPPPKREATVPRPFDFHSDARLEARNDWEQRVNLKKAGPKKRGNAAGARRPAAERTVPKAFHFHTEARLSARVKREQELAAKSRNEESSNKPSRFRARPVPKTTYKAVPVGGVRQPGKGEVSLERQSETKTGNALANRSSPSKTVVDSCSGSETGEIDQLPTSTAVPAIVAEFDKPENVALMPDKSITPKRLVIPKSPPVSSESAQSNAATHGPGAGRETQDHSVLSSPPVSTDNSKIKMAAAMQEWASSSFIKDRRLAAALSNWAGAQSQDPQAPPSSARPTDVMNNETSDSATGAEPAISEQVNDENSLNVNKVDNGGSRLASSKPTILEQEQANSAPRVVTPNSKQEGLKKANTAAKSNPTRRSGETERRPLKARAGPAPTHSHKAVSRISKQSPQCREDETRNRRVVSESPTDRKGAVAVADRFVRLCEEGSEDAAMKLVVDLPDTVVDADKRTVLHIACLHGMLPVVEALLESKRFTVRTQDINGDTAMHCAARSTDLGLVRFLVQHLGLDESHEVLAIRNHQGETPLDVARKYES